MVAPEDSVVLEVERATSTAHRLLNYEGVCSNVHGHNLEWEVELTLSGVSKPDNMSVDFKDVSDYIDYTDHAVLLNENDPLLEESLVPETVDEFESVSWTKEIVDPLGEVIVFEGDPTCEILVDWMAELLVTEIDSAAVADVSLSETEKYTITSGRAFDTDQMEEL
jgi:6-pyruvoyl-tetrahydropterin synthase